MRSALPRPLLNQTARCPAGKEGSHYDPDCDLFQPSEKNMVLTSDAFMIGMLGLLAACTAKLGVAAMFNLYFVPCECEVHGLSASCPVCSCEVVTGSNGSRYLPRSSGFFWRCRAQCWQQC